MNSCVERLNDELALLTSINTIVVSGTADRSAKSMRAAKRF